MRRTTSLAVLLLGAALVSPTGIASATGETCRGEAATIVGTGPDVYGTDGRDVIVTGASLRVAAGAGDDVICVTGAGPTDNVRSVDAGAGNDLVDSTAIPTSFYLTAILGEGSDTFVGGTASDRVFAGPTTWPHAVVPDEAERDVIDTGGGKDVVTSGGHGATNDDEIRTGDGDDYVMWSGTMGAGAVLDAGAGEADVLRIRTAGHTFRIDLAARTLTQDGVLTGSFSSFEETRVAHEPGARSVEILGTDGQDVVDVSAAATLRVDLRDGADRLTLADLGVGSNTIDLGAGTDVITTRSHEGSVEVDLVDGSMSFNDARARLDGVDNVYAIARRVTLVGDDLPNSLIAVGCLATIDGGGGDDRIAHSNYDFDAEYGFECDESGTTLRGGPGDDEISGGKRADRIAGGSGDDDITTGPATSGKNKALGGRGDDVLDGGSAQDVLVGGAGNDRLKGDKQADALRGGAGKDVLVAGPGRDRVQGGKQADKMRGNAGNDLLLGGTGRDSALGGPGRDRCAAERQRSCER